MDEMSIHGTYKYDSPNIILEITTEESKTSETWLGIVQDDNSIYITTIGSVFVQEAK